MMLLAAVEHAARTFVKALAERCCGPAGYEDSDYLAADRRLDAWSAQTPAEFDQLVDSHNAEVSEPRNVDVHLTYMGCGLDMESYATGFNAGYEQAQEHNWPPIPSSTTPPASQPPVDDDSWPADSDIPPSPAGQPPTPAASAGRAESSPPEVSAPTAPSGEQGTPGSFAAVAVREVLAGTVPCGRGRLSIEDARTDDWSADDWYDWREHVSAEVRRRIDSATESQARQFIETGHDMGVSIACETFPQYRGGRS